MDRQDKSFIGMLIGNQIATGNPNSRLEKAIVYLLNWIALDSLELASKVSIWIDHTEIESLNHSNLPAKGLIVCATFVKLWEIVRSLSLSCRTVKRSEEKLQDFWLESFSTAGNLLMCAADRRQPANWNYLYLPSAVGEKQGHSKWLCSVIYSLATVSPCGPWSNGFWLANTLIGFHWTYPLDNIGKHAGSITGKPMTLSSTVFSGYYPARESYLRCER